MSLFVHYEMLHGIYSVQGPRGGSTSLTVRGGGTEASREVGCVEGYPLPRNFFGKF